MNLLKRLQLNNNCTSETVTDFLKRAPTFHHRNILQPNASQKNRYEKLRPQLQTLFDSVLKLSFQKYSDYLSGKCHAKVAHHLIVMRTQLREHLCKELGLTTMSLFREDDG